MNIHPCRRTPLMLRLIFRTIKNTGRVHEEDFGDFGNCQKCALIIDKKAWRRNASSGIKFKFNTPEGLEE